MENSPASLVHNSVFVGTNEFNNQIIKSVNFFLAYEAYKLFEDKQHTPPQQVFLKSDHAILIQQ